MFESCLKDVLKTSHVLILDFVLSGNEKIMKSYRLMF